MGLFDWFRKKSHLQNRPKSFCDDNIETIQKSFASEGQDGWMLRGYSSKQNIYYMMDSYFDLKLPRWIKDVEVPLVEGKGIPTALYFDIVCMKQLKVDIKKLNKIIICRVHDWNSIFHLFWLSKEYPNKKLDDLFQLTRLFKSRMNVMIQTSLKVKSVEIDLDGANFSHPPHLVNDKFSQEEMFSLCKLYNVSGEDMVLWNFNVIIKVKSE